MTFIYLGMIPLGTGFCLTYAAHRWLGHLAALACCALSLTFMAGILCLCLLSLFKTGEKDWALSAFWIIVTVLLNTGCFLGLWEAKRHLQRRVEGGNGITRL